MKYLLLFILAFVAVGLVSASTSSPLSCTTPLFHFLPVSGTLYSNSANTLTMYLTTSTNSVGYTQLQVNATQFYPNNGIPPNSIVGSAVVPPAWTFEYTYNSLPNVTIECVPAASGNTYISDSLPNISNLIENMWSYLIFVLISVTLYVYTLQSFENDIDTNSVRPFFIMALSIMFAFVSLLMLIAVPTVTAKFAGNGSGSFPNYTETINSTVSAQQVNSAIILEIPLLGFEFFTLVYFYIRRTQRKIEMLQHPDE